MRPSPWGHRNFGTGIAFPGPLPAAFFFFPADNGKQGSDPFPVLPSLGASVSYELWGPLAIELTEDLYFTNYEYNSVDNYPMACNPENRSAFVFGFFTGLQLRALFGIGRGINLRAYGGPAMDIRIVALAQNLHPDDFTGEIETDARMQTNAIRNYFWSSGRWFMPVLGSGIDFPVNEKFLLGFDLRMWMPIYRAWTNEKLPPIEGWRFGLGLRISPRKTQSAVSEQL